MPHRVPDTVSALRRCNHLAHQPAKPAYVAGGIDGVAEADDDEMLRGQHDDALAEIARGKKRIAGNAETYAALGARIVAAIGPEPCAVVGVERCRRGKIDPILVQNFPAAGYPVLQIEQAETRPVPCAG